MGLNQHRLTRRTEFSVSRISLIVALFCALGAPGRSPVWQRKDWDPNPESHLPQSGAQAWRLYLGATTRLHSGEDLETCARLFGAVHRQYPMSRYSEDSRELEQCLSTMAIEDRERERADNWRELPTEGQIAYHIHGLRDVAFAFTYGYGSGPPTEEDWQRLDAEGRYCALSELRRLGDSALVPVSELLTDRRPTRSLFYPDASVPERRVLRYQDLAAMVLYGTVPKTLLGHAYGASFSTSPEADRRRMAGWVSEWCRESRGRTELEKRWLAARLDPEVNLYRSEERRVGKGCRSRWCPDH